MAKPNTLRIGPPLWLRYRPRSADGFEYAQTLNPSLRSGGVPERTPNASSWGISLGHRGSCLEHLGLLLSMSVLALCRGVEPSWPVFAD